MMEKCQGEGKGCEKKIEKQNLDLAVDKFRNSWKELKLNIHFSS